MHDHVNGFVFSHNGPEKGVFRLEWIYHAKPSWPERAHHLIPEWPMFDSAQMGFQKRAKLSNRLYRNPEFHR